MESPQLHPEIWIHVVKHLERPKPRHGHWDWAKLHQQDLATMMRVSKMLRDITTPILYREPIVENLWSFFEVYDPHARPIRGKSTCPTSMQDSRSLSFKQVKKLHLIHTSNSWKFSYSDLFTLACLPGEEEVQQNMWNILVDFDDPKLQLSCMPGLFGFGIRYHPTIKMLSTMSKSTAGKALRPEALTFGVWGSRSWDSVHHEIARDLRIPVYSSLAVRERYNAFQNELIGFSSTLRNNWGGYHHPKYSCTHMIGGPYGSCGQPRLLWGGTGGHIPQVVVTHVHHEGLDYAFSVGSRNVIIYQDETRSMEYDTSLNPLAGLDEIIKAWDQTMVQAPIKNLELLEKTQIDVYGLDGDISPFHTPKTLQRKLNAELKVLKGKVKIHSYEETPTCPACGWKRQ